MRGTVKFFNNEKGFGFISREDGDDVFVHFSNIVGENYRTLEAGQEVEFEIGPGRKGDEAQSVKPSELGRRHAPCGADPRTRRSDHDRAARLQASESSSDSPRVSRLEGARFEANFDMLSVSALMSCSTNCGDMFTRCTRPRRAGATACR